MFTWHRLDTDPPTVSGAYIVGNRWRISGPAFFYADDVTQGVTPIKGWVSINPREGALPVPTHWMEVPYPD